jgi:hypothetical protein
MPSLNDYGKRATEYAPGDLVRVKRHSRFAHLTESLRPGKVEKVEPRRLLVRLKHASFWLTPDQLQGEQS